MSSDHVVVGGGVYGAAAARELAERGEEVVLLEADRVASGASGGLGKRGVRANGRDPRELPLAARARDRWASLAADHDVGYDRTGHLLLYEHDHGTLSGGYAGAPARARLQRNLGVETECLDESEVRSLEPHASESVVGALHCPDDGVADHTRATRLLADLAADRGATVHEGTPVRGFERDGERVTAVTTGDGRFGVDGEALLLSNAHVPGVLEREFGVELPVWEAYPQVIATEPMDEVPVEHLIGHDGRRLALKELPEDRVMISGGWCGQPDGRGGGRTRPEAVRGNVEEAAAVFPPLAEAAVEEADAGRAETVSADGVPVIDRVPGTENLLTATGWCGHGYAIAPAVARLLARWAVEDERPGLLAPFAADRFGADPDGD